MILKSSDRIKLTAVELYGMINKKKMLWNNLCEPNKIRYVLESRTQRILAERTNLSMKSLPY